MDSKYKLPGGATRSERAPDYSLIPVAGMECIVRRFELGRDTHGSWQWMKSLDTLENAQNFSLEAINHLYVHLASMLTDGTEKDDHLGAVGWAVCVLAYARAVYGDEGLPVQPKPPTRLTLTKEQMP